MRLWFCLLLWSCASLASAQDPDPVRQALLGWGCEALDVLEIAPRSYAACGAQGVFIVERRADQLALIERRSVSGAARAVYLRGDSVWVETAHTDARPLADLAPAAPPAPTPATPSAPPAPIPPSELTLPSPLLRPVQPREESRLFPSRVGGVTVLELSVRPLLPIDTRAFGGIGELALSYIGERHWFVQARGFPLGGIIGEGRDTPLMGALAQGGYDHPYFAIGIGAGALTRGAWHEDYDPTIMNYRHRTTQSTRFAIGQYARLGPSDGLNLTAQSLFVLLDDWKFGFFELRGQIPLTRGTWLTPGGAGGAQAGFFYGEIGLRHLLLGDRRSGSLFVRPSVGVAGVDKRDRFDSMRIGPMIGFHVEWRK
jgi:hypothetical protein